MIEIHDAANIFPLDEENIGDLAKDIREHGQMVPIERMEGKVIDGRRRLKACQIAGVEPKFIDLSPAPADPVAYVLSINLHRRQLTPSQRSMIAARVRELYDAQAKERMEKGRPKKGVETLPQDTGKARDLAGKAVGVSGGLVDRATKVLEQAVPEVAQAVDEGRLSVSAAAQLADEDEEVQREAAKEASFSGGRFRKPALKPKPVVEDGPPAGEFIGVGVMHAKEAINCLMRIPKNDAHRKRGFQIVTDWIKHNP